MQLRPENLEYYVARARDILMDVARGKRGENFIEYKALMDEMGGPGRGFIGEVLEEVCREEYEKGHPLLSAIVIHKTNRSPGNGFWHLAVLPEKIKNATDAEKRTYWMNECGKVWEFWKYH